MIFPNSQLVSQHRWPDISTKGSLLALFTTPSYLWKSIPVTFHNHFKSLFPVQRCQKDPFKLPAGSHKNQSFKGNSLSSSFCL
jgi:hypothetical protein